jgi:glutathione peroxidase
MVFFRVLLEVRTMTKLRGTLAMLAMLAAMFGGAPADAAEDTAHAFAFTSIEGSPLPFSSFRGKTVLVVNTASFCGFTKHYAGLQELWERYRDRGLVVLGVPSNDFGGQEPGTEAEIKTFCETEFGITFPLTEKYAVSGAEAHPFYKWAATHAGALGTPQWNFHKYLIGPDGQFLDWFPTKTEPTSAKIVQAIEAALPQS